MKCLQTLANLLENQLSFLKRSTDLYNCFQEPPMTAPPIGMKRTHSVPDMTSKKGKDKENVQKQRTPKQLITAHLKSREAKPPKPPSNQRAKSAR